jgi:hypothetical protein
MQVTTAESRRALSRRLEAARRAGDVRIETMKDTVLGDVPVFRRDLADGRLIVAMPLLFGQWRLGLGRKNDPWGFDHVYDYADVHSAMSAMLDYAGEDEPTGWHRRDGQPFTPQEAHG